MPTIFLKTSYKKRNVACTQSAKNTIVHTGKPKVYKANNIWEYIENLLEYNEELENIRNR